jgi:hypothetical protein
VTDQNPSLQEQIQRRLSAIDEASAAEAEERDREKERRADIAARRRQLQPEVAAVMRSEADDFARFLVSKGASPNIQLRYERRRTVKKGLVSSWFSGPGGVEIEVHLTPVWIIKASERTSISRARQEAWGMRAAYKRTQYAGVAIDQEHELWAFVGDGPGERYSTELVSGGLPEPREGSWSDLSPVRFAADAPDLRPRGRAESNDIAPLNQIDPGIADPVDQPIVTAWRESLAAVAVSVLR